VSVPKAISDRRDHDRIHSISLEIVLDGIRYPAIDWSLGGVLVANYYGVRTLGDEIHGSFRICSDMNSHPFKAVVVRYNSTGGQLALEFLSLSFRAITVLEAFMTGRSRA
jgi:hypothetical protein